MPSRFLYFPHLFPLPGSKSAKTQERLPRFNDWRHSLRHLVEMSIKLKASATPATIRHSHFAFLRPQLVCRDTLDQSIHPASGDARRIGEYQEHFW